MSIQIIWKRLTKNDAPLLMAISLLRPPPFNAKPHFKSLNFCTQIVPSSTTPPGRGYATEFLIHKCSLTDEEITKAFRHKKELLRAKSSQNMENVLELLKGCGLTTLAQIRKVAICNPRFFFFSAERNLKAKLSFLRTFIKEEDVAKFIQSDAGIFHASERTLKSGISVLQKMGIEGEALSDLLVRQPRLLVTSEEKVTESFKLAEGFGFKKGSKMFAKAVNVIFELRKENLDRKLQYLSNLGFSEKQISHLLRRRPSILAHSEEKMKRNVDFMIKTVGVPLAEFVKYPDLLVNSLETRMIPRYRVMEALKSMQLPKRRRCFPKIIELTEKRFLEEYVNSNAEFSSVLQDIYRRGKPGRLIIGEETCIPLHTRLKK